MSAATVFRARKARPRPPAELEPTVLAFVLGTVIVDVGILLFGVLRSPTQFTSPGWELVIWLAVVAAVGLASVPFEGGQQLGLDMPVLLAAGYVFGPFVAGSLALVAYVDPREWQGQIPFVRALFNRAQTSLSVMGASAVFGLVTDGSRDEWPLTILAALLAVGADCLVNYGTVIAAISLHERIGPVTSLSRLSIGSLPTFATTYLSFGLLSMMLAEIYVAVGGWSLAVFALPVLLARQAFSSHRQLDQANKQVAAQAEALMNASTAVADERRQERLSLAAGLHDDVLPPIYKVHLMGQVLRQDLASGQLFALEEDLPQLLKATEHASESTRSLIRALRDSPLGAGGLSETLALLVQYLREGSSADIRLQCDDVKGTPLVQLLTYQVAREALRNALRHSEASRISVTVTDSEGDVRLVVEDNGNGFRLDSVDQHSHFGLTLMRERVELAGGIVQIESRPGVGTVVVARLPSGSMSS